MTQPKPVVRPTRKILSFLIVGSILPALLFIAFANTTAMVATGFFLLALCSSIVTFGVLGATGMWKGKHGQLGGSAAALIIIFGILIPFIPQESTITLRGLMLVNNAFPKNARIVLLDTNSPDQVVNITPSDHGAFSIGLVEKKRSYQFVISVPGYEDHLVETEPSGDKRVRIVIAEASLTRAADESSSSTTPLEEDLITRLNACRPPDDTCRLMVFDFLVNDVSASELSIFHELHIERLRRGLLAHFNSLNLLEADLQVSRCSAYVVQNGEDAKQVATALAIPVILWGFIEKQDNQLASLMSMTIAGEPPVTLFQPQQIGNSVIEFAGLNQPLDTQSIAATAFLLGEYYQQKNRPILALQAYLHAREQSSKSMPFVQILDDKIQTLQQQSIAMRLTPINR